MRKLLPLILALFGTGAGVAAGIFLAPEPAVEAPAEDDPAHDDAAHDEDGTAKPEKDKAGKADKDEGDSGYVKLNNQFVVPVIDDDRVRSIVVVSLSVEVPTGKTETVYTKEPKLRDAFLQVLFDHANIGGFNGAFTTSPRMDALRKSLVTAAGPILGPDLRNVLITDISRQDT